MKRSPDTIFLFHGTDSSTTRRVLNGAPLIGRKLRDHPYLSGILTDSLMVARFWGMNAVSKTGNLDNRVTVMAIEAPRKEVENLGPIFMRSEANGYCSRHPISPNALPKDYLQRIGLTRPEARRMVRDGWLSFYEIPPNWPKRLI